VVNYFNCFCQPCVQVLQKKKNCSLKRGRALAKGLLRERDQPSDFSGIKDASRGIGLRRHRVGKKGRKGRGRKIPLEQGREKSAVFVQIGYRRNRRQPRCKGVIAKSAGVCQGTRGKSTVLYYAARSARKELFSNGVTKGEEKSKESVLGNGGGTGA